MVSPADIRRKALKKKTRKRYRGRAGRQSPLYQILGIRQDVH